MVYTYIHQSDRDSHLEEVENGWVVSVDSCLVSKELEVCNELINVSFFHL